MPIPAARDGSPPERVTSCSRDTVLVPLLSLLSPAGAHVGTSDVRSSEQKPLQHRTPALSDPRAGELHVARASTPGKLAALAPAHRARTSPIDRDPVKLPPLHRDRDRAELIIAERAAQSAVSSRLSRVSPPAATPNYRTAGAVPHRPSDPGSLPSTKAERFGPSPGPQSRTPGTAASTSEPPAPSHRTRSTVPERFVADMP